MSQLGPMSQIAPLSLAHFLLAPVGPVAPLGSSILTQAKTFHGTPGNFCWNLGKFFLELADFFCGSGSKICRPVILYSVTA